MRALRFHGAKDIRLEDIPEPQVRPGAVKIKVDWCGICGSDLHEYLAGPIATPPAGQPHSLTGEQPPIVLGHEFAGRITEVGDGVEGLRTGDTVAVEPIIHDGTCDRCREGTYNLCDQRGFVGLSGWGGGLSEYVVLPAAMAHKLPEGIGTDIGALVEPLAVAWHAVRRSRIPLGGTALVLGAGPIGLALTLCLRAAGARLVLVSEVSPAHQRAAAELGADAVLDPGQQDVTAAVRELTGGTGTDVCFDASGLPVTLQTALASVRKQGRVVNIAAWERPVEFQPNLLLGTEADYTGALAYTGDHPAVIAALARGAIDPAPMITARIALEDAIEHGFEELLRNKDRHVKILVRP